MPHSTVEQQYFNRSNLGLTTCHTRRYITQALQWERAGVEIEPDLRLCQCTKEYLSQTGKTIDRLDRLDYEQIGDFYHQLTGNICPSVSLKLREIGVIIRNYTSAMGQEN